MEQPSTSFLHKLTSSSPSKLFTAVLVAALILGVGTGYILASGNKSSGLAGSAPGASNAPKSAAADNQTFKDFAVGTIQPKPSPKDGEDDYSEGAYLLQRDNAVPVALTSSVVDLSQYVGKKVKVYGETQQALKQGWLMDVGKVEVQ